MFNNFHELMANGTAVRVHKGLALFRIEILPELLKLVGINDDISQSSISYHNKVERMVLLMINHELHDQGRDSYRLRLPFVIAELEFISNEYCLSD